VDSVFKMDSKCAVPYSTNGTGLADHNRTCSSHVYRTVYKYEAMFGCYKFTIESGGEGILKFCSDTPAAVLFSPGWDNWQRYVVV
jgi:hypothetical protein